MAPIVLKIKGNKSFSPFSFMDSEDELSKTWRVCTKVKDSLENGSRLENLSWRLWFVHNVLNDNTKAASFRNLPSAATLQLDKEKCSLPTLKRTTRKDKTKASSNTLTTTTNISTAESAATTTSSFDGSKLPPSSQKRPQVKKPPTRLPLAAARDSELQYRRTLRQQQLAQARLCQPSPPIPTSHNKASVGKPSVPPTLPQQVQQQQKIQQTQQDRLLQQTQLDQPQQPQQPQYSPHIHQQQQQQQHHQQPYPSQFPLNPHQQRQQQYQLHPQGQQNNLIHPSYSSVYNQQMMEEFVLHRYTSDQACDQVVQLQNTINNNNSNIINNNNNNNIGDINAYGNDYLNNSADTAMGMMPPVDNGNAIYTDTDMIAASQSTPTTTDYSNIINQTASSPLVDTKHGAYPSYDYAAASIPSTPNIPSPFDTQSGFYDSNVIQKQQNPLAILNPQSTTTTTTQQQQLSLQNQPQHQHQHQHQQQQQLQEPYHPNYDEMNSLQDFLNSSIPTNFLTHNSKLLSTLPPETLASAERLLLPSNVSQHVMGQQYQQQQESQQYQQQHHHQQQQQQQQTHQKQISPSSSTSTSNYQPASTNFQQVNLSAPNTPFPQSTPSNDIHHGIQPAPTQSLPSSRPTSPTNEKRHRTALIVNSTPSEGKAPICSNCESTSTPLWRRSANDDLLCNACGLYLKLHKTSRPKYLKPHLMKGKDGGTEQEVVQTVCSNCATTTTPLWRRDLEGQPLCNACGLYLKLHHEKRPLSMKTDVIKKRQRCDNTNTTTTTTIAMQPHSQRLDQDTVMDDYTLNPSSSQQPSSSTSSSSSSSSSASLAASKSSSSTSPSPSPASKSTSL